MANKELILLVFMIAIFFATGCTLVQEQVNQTFSEETNKTAAQPGVQIQEPFEEHRQETNVPGGFGERPGFFPRLLSNLPECADQKFTEPPVALADIYEIIPLGNLNPPEHTLPTEHMYFHLSATGRISSPVEIRAPGNIRLTSMQITKYLSEGREDYGLTFGLCKEIFGYFLHIKKLSPELSSLAANARCEPEHSGSGNYEYCRLELDQEMTAGELIGMVGDETQANFDFGTYDLRTKLDYVNPSRYDGDRSLHIVCPIELYEEGVRESLYEKVSRKGEPKCGQVMQDKEGTLQGNWFYGKTTATRDWDKHLSFIHNNEDASKAAIGIGGVFADAGTWLFTPRMTGTINREFSEIVSDGNIYCYQGENQNGKIVVQLLSDEELKIEHQSGSCSTVSSFSNPTTYKR